MIKNNYHKAYAIGWDFPLYVSKNKSTMKDEHISSNGPPHPIFLFIFFRILSIFNIHTHEEREEN